MSNAAPLPFTLYPLPVGTSLSAHFADGRDRCGIYVLTHEDGTKYVGRALDVVRRSAAHARHAGHAPGKRIVTVHFAPVPPVGLVQRERDAVGYCEQHGIKLRNKLLTGNPAGDSPLNLTVTEAVQQVLLADEETPRLPEDWPRGRTGRAGKANTGRLLEHQAVADTLTALAFYLCYALPADYGSVATEHCTSNGHMQTVDLDAETTASALCHDPVFRTAARRAAVGLMRKGSTAQGRHHDWALADAVYAHIDELLEITR